MTMYTEDVDYRMRTVFFIIAVFAVLIGFGMQRAAPGRPSLIAPVTLMSYAAVFWLFDAFLWKVPVIRLLNSGIPNLAGIWKGKLVRRKDGVERELEAELLIKQTWSKLELILTTPEATSQNTLAGMTLADRNNILMTWIYRIEGADPHSLLDHGKGIIELALKRNGKQLALSGEFIESSAGEPLETVLVKRSFMFWNPKPF